MKAFTEAEKLEVVEQLISAIKQRRLDDLRGGSLHVDVLRTLTADIKARRPGAGGPALLELEHKMQRLKSADLINDREALRSIGQSVVEHWPEVRAALVDLTVNNARRGE
jgi:hypothetical protein